MLPVGEQSKRFHLFLHSVTVLGTYRSSQNLNVTGAIRMKIKAAVAWGPNQPLKIEEVENKVLKKNGSHYVN